MATPRLVPVGRVRPRAANETLQKASTKRPGSRTSIVALACLAGGAAAARTNIGVLQGSIGFDRPPPRNSTRKCARWDNPAVIGEPTRRLPPHHCPGTETPPTTVDIGPRRSSCQPPLG